jgi:hypothetical protein
MILFFLLVYFIIITAVIEIFVILFRLTGLKVEVSRFQVISMMTGTGFTTGESELILGHPIRRKLAIFLILFGAFSLAVIISSISQFLSEGLRTMEVALVAGGVLVIYFVLRLSIVQQGLSRFFNREMKQNVELADLPVRDLFFLSKEDTVLSLHIYKESSIYGKTIQAFDYEEKDFVVLFIKRGDVKLRKNLYNTTLHEGDELFLYGTEKVIHEVFERDWGIMEEKQKDELEAGHFKS